MKRFISVFSFTACALASSSLYALKLMPASVYEYPLVLNVDGEKHIAEDSHISLLSYVFNESEQKLNVPKEDPENKQKVAGHPAFGKDSYEGQVFLINWELLPKIIYHSKNGDLEKLGECLLNPKDSKRAQKFIEMMKPEETIIKAQMSLDDDRIAYFFESKNSKLRPDMNYMFFKPGEKSWLWDLSEKSHFMAMLSESVRFAESKKSEDTKTGIKAKFVSLQNGRNADNPVFVFYQRAQKEFYDMRLEEYPKFMTQKSAEVFTSQFLSMSKEDQEKVLFDYITWHKVFYGIYDTGKVKVIVFKRVKECATHEMYDCAYIIETADGLKLANFGQNQGVFADFIVERSKAEGF